MSYKKFSYNDLFNNVIKTKPRFEFKIYGGKISLNGGAGYSYLNTINLDIRGCDIPFAFDFSCEDNSYNIAMI